MSAGQKICSVKEKKKKKEKKEKEKLKGEVMCRRAITEHCPNSFLLKCLLNITS